MASAATSSKSLTSQTEKLHDVWEEIPVQLDIVLFLQRYGIYNNNNNNNNYNNNNNNIGYLYRSHIHPARWLKRSNFTPALLGYPIMIIIRYVYTAQLFKYILLRWVKTKILKVDTQTQKYL